MREFSKKHRVLCVVVGVAVLAVLFVFYLHALLQPGFWHRNTFLYLQEDGRFVGYDEYATYQMEILPNDQGTEIFFAANETEKHYQIMHDTEDTNVEIVEDEKLIFRGVVLKINDFYLLEDENRELADMITVEVGGVAPQLEELFPGCTKLYNWAIAEKYDVRGHLQYFFYAIFALLFLLIDLFFPNFFWNIRYALAVDGGEPSAFYRFGQVIGRVLLGLFIFIAIMNSFGVH